jgi:hypothetical protein
MHRGRCSYRLRPEFSAAARRSAALDHAHLAYDRRHIIFHDPAAGRRRPGPQHRHEEAFPEAVCRNPARGAAAAVTDSGVGARPLRTRLVCVPMEPALPEDAAMLMAIAADGDRNAELGYPEWRSPPGFWPIPIRLHEHVAGPASRGNMRRLQILPHLARGGIWQEAPREASSHESSRLPWRRVCTPSAHSGLTPAAVRGVVPAGRQQRVCPQTHTGRCAPPVLAMIRNFHLLAGDSFPCCAPREAAQRG